MRYAVIVGADEEQPAVFGSFKSAPSAQGFARLVGEHGASAVVVPIHPGRAFDADNPSQPKELA